MEYLQGKNDEDKSKMIKYTVLSGFGIVCLLTIGMVELIEGRTTGNRIFRSKKKIIN
jgi:hypothetical protein